MKISKSSSRLKTTLNSYSKSVTNRALILAALNPKSVKIFNPSLSEDSLHLVKALEAIGISVNQDGSDLLVKNCIFELNDTEKKTIEIGEGGTTIRFFLFLISMIDLEVELKTTTSFLSRPISEYIDLLNSCGAQIFINKRSIHKKGTIIASKLSIDCSKTTQFASAAMLCLGEERVALRNIESSQMYLSMTRKMCQMRNATEFKVPIDMSSIGYLIAYGVCIADIEVENVSEFDYSQADSYLIKILNDLEVEYTLDPHLRIKYREYNKSLNIDISQCLDLAPTLAFVLSYVRGTHVLANVQNLKHKESNRLTGIINLLESFEISFKLDGESLIIYGEDQVVKSEVHLNVEYDHRMVMTGILFLLKNNGGSINNIEAINKSYASFKSDLQIT